MSEHIDANINKPSAAIQAITTVGSICHLALRGAQELTHLVAEVHGTINQLPMPFNKQHQPDARYAPFPYRIISHSFALFAKLSRLFAGEHKEFAHPLAIRSQAALNGVCGDKLVDWESPLATHLSLRSEQGLLIEDINAWANEPAKAHVLFIHGLCHSDVEWQAAENHYQFYCQLAQLGYQVAWLRYNTGRAIHDNGAELAALLNSHFAAKGTPLLLIGHSMGGLLIRSACHYAEQENHSWLKRLTHAAYLGSPHLGAPLERLGNQANNLLNITPYTRPFMRLGNIRSRGIKDLRYARLTHDNVLPHLYEGISHLLLAGAISESHSQNWIGDGLVPVDSALAQDEQGYVLDSPKIRRVYFDEMNHLAMLNDPRVYQELADWLGIGILLETIH
ncbi:alpha/beta fold hydrolase [Agitococcus lubricus]|uniref:Alpha/beta hydrolase family protein n=1 Tax=Agitococcus lubricus TaxID=1077255 RepID=A0A2T5IWU4_9GAMM|nr:alpha/beta fold hydrolase [Agitococcus lubricus]PTQ88404.1 alpha/beta hydrolase family protein [Agitococcus lubricus]